MAFSKDATKVRTNGRTILQIVATSGAYVDMGFIANAVAKGAVLAEETTLGDLPVAWDLSIEADLKQTSSADWSAILDVPFPTSVMIVGPNDTATLTSPTIVPDLEKKFDGKTGSKIGLKIMFKGANKTQAKAFLADAS